VHEAWVSPSSPLPRDAPENADAFLARRQSEDRARLAEALESAGRGDRSAFEQLYAKTSAKLFGICLRIFPDRQEAEDALQDAYITIWNRAATFDASRASPITWLAIVTRNRAIDRLRARGKAQMAPLEAAEFVADDAPLADAQMIAHQDGAALKGCIDSLEAKDAAFIRAAFLGGATYADLAERDGLPLGTVKSRIRRALIKLRECLSG
jgi:RNA polymerase sigma-70 factor, ECF subfamily